MPGKNREEVELLNAVETGGVRNAQILKDDVFVDANRDRCIKGGMHSVLARYTNPEAGGASYSRKSLGRTWRSHL